MEPEEDNPVRQAQELPPVQADDDNEHRDRHACQPVVAIANAERPTEPSLAAETVPARATASEAARAAKGIGAPGTAAHLAQESKREREPRRPSAGRRRLACTRQQLQSLSRDKSDHVRRLRSRTHQRQRDVAVADDLPPELAPRQVARDWRPGGLHLGVDRGEASKSPRTRRRGHATEPVAGRARGRSCPRPASSQYSDGRLRVTGSRDQNVPEQAAHSVQARHWKGLA